MNARDALARKPVSIPMNTHSQAEIIPIWTQLIAGGGYA